jgi:hypothetical protein
MSKGGKREGSGRPSLGPRKMIIFEIPLALYDKITGIKNTWICEAIKQKIEMSPNLENINKWEHGRVLRIVRIPLDWYGFVPWADKNRNSWICEAIRQRIEREAGK